MGVATDCSTVWASAPMNVVLMRASGGTIFGNWAIGSPRKATRPRITVMIAMTIATIGRLMKNFDTARLPGGLCRGERKGIHQRAVPDLLQPLSDDPVARLQPGKDGDEVAERLADRRRHDVDPVVGVDRGKLVAPLELVQGAPGDEERALLGPNDGADARVLARAEQPARVGELGDDHERAGVSVHGTVHCEERAL